MGNISPDYLPNFGTLRLTAKSQAIALKFWEQAHHIAMRGSTTHYTRVEYDLGRRTKRCFTATPLRAATSCHEPVAR
jgi:hypothetical protein